MGYTSGNPDLMILTPNKFYNGFMIEFKNPNGIYSVSNKQELFLQKSILNNHKVLLSNDYNQIIKSIIEYFLYVRLSCPFCKRKFISESSLNKHCKYFHKKSHLLEIKL